ncbi:hypothetical protein [Streptomyces pseudoechinosporeus]
MLGEESCRLIDTSAWEQDRIDRRVEVPLNELSADALGGGWSRASEGPPAAIPAQGDGADAGRAGPIGGRLPAVGDGASPVLALRRAAVLVVLVLGGGAGVAPAIGPSPRYTGRRTTIRRHLCTE